MNSQGVRFKLLWKERPKSNFQDEGDGAAKAQYPTSKTRGKEQPRSEI
jgi:hypothetical protein